MVACQNVCVSIEVKSIARCPPVMLPAAASMVLSGDIQSRFTCYIMTCMDFRRCHVCVHAITYRVGMFDRLGADATKRFPESHCIIVSSGDQDD